LNKYTFVIKYTNGDVTHIKTKKEVFGGISQFVRDQCSEGSDF